MLHSENDTIIADNGVQVFANCDIEVILSDRFDTFINENGSREYRYTTQEICENWDISESELSRMEYLLSYEYNHRGE